MNSELTIPLIPQLIGKLEDKYCRIGHRYNFVQQLLKRPTLGITGGYHFGNLGDMALGYSVQRQADRLKVHSDLQTLYNLSQWPRADSVIVGGGAVAYKEPLEQLRRLYGDSPERVAMLGVDFNDPVAIKASRDFLVQVPIITCRSSSQTEWLKKELGRSNIGWHFDLCFSYYDEYYQEAEERKPIFGINVVSFFYLREGNNFHPGTEYLEEIKEHQPEIVPEIDLLGGRYVELVRAVVQEAKAAGFRVVHFPFTPSDDIFARTTLSDLDITFRPYTFRPASVLQAMKQCQRFFTTRFHALVFSLVTQTPFVAFNYATKCERLLADLAVSKESQITLTNLRESDSYTALAQRAVHGPKAFIEEEKIRIVGKQVVETIQKAIEYHQHP